MATKRLIKPISIFCDYNRTSTANGTFRPMSREIYGELNYILSRGYLVVGEMHKLSTNDFDFQIDLRRNLRSAACDASLLMDIGQAFRIDRVQETVAIKCE